MATADVLPAEAAAAPSANAQEDCTEQPPRAEWVVTEADRVEARKYLQFLVESRIGAPKRKIEAISSEREGQLCALRKQTLMDYIARCGGDGAEVASDTRVRNRRPLNRAPRGRPGRSPNHRREITVSCKQRKGGETEGGLDFYFHATDGRRFRSNKEVATKLYKLQPASSKKQKTSVASSAGAPVAPAAPASPAPGLTPPSVAQTAAAVATPVAKETVSL